MKTCAKTRKIVPLVLALLLLFGGCSAVNRAAVFGTNGNETTRRQDVLTVEFLDVGQANAALLTCGGKSLLIDGGNVADGAKVTRAVQAATDRLDYVVIPMAMRTMWAAWPLWWMRCRWVRPLSAR